MSGFSHLKELLNTLTRSKELLIELFEKRKQHSYKYEHAVQVLEEALVEALIQKEIIRKSGPYIELDEQYLDFFEQVLEVNEDINTAQIVEQIEQIRHQISFYLQENNELRKYNYLKTVKSALRKTGRMALRNIIDLNRNIENTYKAEPNYRIKLAKLEAFDEKRKAIEQLIEQTEALITEREKTFFIAAADDELRALNVHLRQQLSEGRHNLIETQKQIIQYLNQVKDQNRIAEKIKQLKYLKDQFELKHKSNIESVLAEYHAACFLPRSVASFKLSPEFLEEDRYHELISKVAARMRLGKKPARPLAEPISLTQLDTQAVEEVYINLEELRRGFLASGKHLFAFVMEYRYPKPMTLEEKVNVYCQIVGMFEKDLLITDAYQQQDDIEYAIVTPRN
ncbi:MAG: hypothetical protein EOO15_04455 [Chitinophagaceae bacterium]|nr:MAG: hypothetical protein EOO15_04455 [Chitinophagaceae bacterium]